MVHKYRHYTDFGNAIETIWYVRGTANCTTVPCCFTGFFKATCLKFSLRLTTRIFSLCIVLLLFNELGLSVALLVDWLRVLSVDLSVAVSVDLSVESLIGLLTVLLTVLEAE